MNEPCAFEIAPRPINARSAAVTVLGALFFVGFAAGFIALGGPGLIGLGPNPAAPAAISGQVAQAPVR